MSITEQVQAVREKLEQAALRSGRGPEEISLVAASKTKPPADIREALAAGIHIFGENRVQELVEKNAAGAYTGAELHFIGQLQRNKVRQLVGHCSLIHSADSLSLLEEIDKRAAAQRLKQAVLLEINIGNEPSKAGFYEAELPLVLDKVSGLSSVFVRGLMAIPPISRISGQNRPYFARMRELFVDISAKKYDNISMDFLSMGMSDDYEDAILEGSNMVRVGSAIFGARIYSVKPE